MWDALSCPRGGFPTIIHNEIHDTLADLMKGVCHDVQIEPGRQPATSELLSHVASSTERYRDNLIKGTLMLGF